jgi:hypothetical protein
VGVGGLDIFQDSQQCAGAICVFRDGLIDQQFLGWIENRMSSGLFSFAGGDWHRSSPAGGAFNERRLAWTDSGGN